MRAILLVAVILTSANAFFHDLGLDRRPKHFYKTGLRPHHRPTEFGRRYIPNNWLHKSGYKHHGWGRHREDVTEPCVTVSQWQGRYSEWDHLKGTNNRYNITFDGINHRQFIEEQRKSMRPGRRLFQYLILHDQHIKYTIDPAFNNCSVSYAGPWRSFSIPPNATLEDQYEIGCPLDNIGVTEWSDRQPARTHESWIGGFTTRGCWPIFEIFTFQNASLSIGVTTRFFDLSPGIQNMSVFDVPDICKNMTPSEPPQRKPWWEKLMPGWVQDLLKEGIDNPEKILDGIEKLLPELDREVPFLDDMLPGDVGRETPLINQAEELDLVGGLEPKSVKPNRPHMEEFRPRPVISAKDVPQADISPPSIPNHDDILNLDDIKEFVGGILQQPQIEAIAAMVSKVASTPVEQHLEKISRHIGFPR